MGFSTFPNNPFPPSSAQFDEGKNNFIQAEIDAIKDGANIDSFGDVETALSTKTNLSNIAPTFDATSGVYAVGDKVIYNGVLYEFTTAHSTAGAWDESEVQPVKVSELIDSLSSGLTNLVKTYTETLTSDAQGLLTSTLSSTSVILDAVFKSYIVIPYRPATGTVWKFVITDVTSDGTIKTQADKTDSLYVHYI